MLAHLDENSLNSNGINKNTIQQNRCPHAALVSKQKKKVKILINSISFSEKFHCCLMCTVCLKIKKINIILQSPHILTFH